MSPRNVIANDENHCCYCPAIIVFGVRIENPVCFAGPDKNALLEFQAHEFVELMAIPCEFVRAKSVMNTGITGTINYATNTSLFSMTILEISKHCLVYLC